MAEVWRAEAPGPEGFVKEVALKLIRGDHDARGEFVRMFVQEARLASRLSHANIVQVFDFDQVDGRYYLAMELVRGRTLREVVDRCRELGLRLGVARAVHVGAEVARALTYAHALEESGRPIGLVHRDVSPQNVLVSFEGEVKLADFGIARALGPSEVTEPGTVKGKLAYMSPEQARGEPVDGRADVFALGAVLWELLAGRRLFARESDAATLTALVSDEPISAPSSWNEAVPPALDAAVLEALHRDPARRTRSAEAFGAALAAVRLKLAAAPGGDEPDLRGFMRRLWPEGAAPGEPPEPTAVRPAGEAVEGGTTRTALAPPRRRPVRAAAAAALAAVALAAAWWWQGSGGAAVIAGPAVAAQALAPPADAPSTNAGAPSKPGSTSGSSSGAAGADSGATSRSASGADPGADSGAVPASAPATLAVRASPWASIRIDGRPAGETPVERTLRAGAHRVEARHPTLGVDEAVLELAPGQRLVWRPRLRR